MFSIEAKFMFIPQLSNAKKADSY